MSCTYFVLHSVWFSNSIVSSTLVWQSTSKGKHLPPYLLICLFIGMDEWIPIYSKLLGIALILKPSQISSSLLCLFNMSLLCFFFFNTFLLSGLRCSRLTLYLPSPSCGISHFFPGNLDSFEWKMILRNQDLGAECPLLLECHLLLGFSWQTE